MYHNMLGNDVMPSPIRHETWNWESQQYQSVFPEIDELVNARISEQNKTLVKKMKRIRTAYTTDQLNTLESVYRQGRYINRNTRLNLAASMGIHESRVKIWFQNRRMREKREREESSSDSSIEQPSQSSKVSPAPSPVPVFSWHNFINNPNKPSSLAPTTTPVLESNLERTENICQENFDPDFPLVSSSLQFPPVEPTIPIQHTTSSPADESESQYQLPYYGHPPPPLASQNVDFCLDPNTVYPTEYVAPQQTHSYNYSYSE